MSESESFTSLMALVDSHLSKVSLQANSSENDNRFPMPRLPLPSLSGAGAVSTSFQSFPGQRLPLPTLSTPDGSIQEVLAMQLNNMLKAKERKKHDEEVEESKKLADLMAKSKIKDEENFVIDLSQAVIDYTNIEETISHTKKKALSKSSSHESLFEPMFIGCDEEIAKTQIAEPLLPCTEDMSFMLKRKLKRGRCSTFGKVLTSRLRPVAAPYLIDDTESTIERFDFSTKSPCDLIKERLRKPSSDKHKFELFRIFPDLELEFKKAELEEIELNATKNNKRNKKDKKKKL